MKNKHSCSEPACDLPAFGRGLCSAHYQKHRYHGTLPAFPEKTCEQCGKAFTDRKWNSIYCSVTCRYRAAYKPGSRTEDNCLQCGNPLDGLRSDARFCSVQCGTDFNNARKAVERRTNRKSCDNCGNPIPLGRQRFCSDECKRVARRPETYGLTQAELEALLAQHGVCAICGTDQWSKKGPQVDHDHATGAVRGILCSNCNLALGLLNDDVARIQAAIDYLSR